MCGRVVQNLTWKEIRDLLKITEDTGSNLQPNWNGAPTQQLFVSTQHEGERKLEQMSWWLTPVWAKEKPKYPTFNAKCETIEEKPTWKGSLNKMRCVVPVSGFYEWKGPKGEKQPYYITRRDGQPMLFAGLYAFNNKIDPDGLLSFTIITCEPNENMAKLHNRMPVIMDASDIDGWLSDDPWGDDHRPLMAPCDDNLITAVPVSNEVGSVKNNHENLIEPSGDAIF